MSPDANVSIRVPKKQKKRPSKQERAPHKLAPSLWPTWLLIGFAWIVVRLPLSWVSALGRSSGRILYYLAGARRRITLRNLCLCFPELTPTQRTQLAKKTFRHVGMGTFELMVPWLNPGKDLTPLFAIKGIKHLRDALDQGRGVLLLGAHYTTMDVISAPLAQCGPIDVMYRFNKNSAWEWLQVQGRKRYFGAVIERENTRQVLKSLKRGRVVWYAPDQDYGAKHSVFAPFFGVQAATITATARFARMNNSPVLLVQHTRDEDTGLWEIKFHPTLEDYPGEDDIADATRLNQALEALIRQKPDQYLWLHKRFKTRPDGEPSLYA